MNHPDPFYCEAPKMPRPKAKAKPFQMDRPAKIRWRIKGETEGPIYVGQRKIVECIPCKRRLKGPDQ